MEGSLDDEYEATPNNVDLAHHSLPQTKFEIVHSVLCSLCCSPHASSSSKLSQTRFLGSDFSSIDSSLLEDYDGSVDSLMFEALMGFDGDIFPSLGMNDTSGASTSSPILSPPGGLPLSLSAHLVA